MSKSTNQKKSETKTSKQLNNPLISVIVRTQNRPHLLAKALQSIAAQTYPLVEAVVVNDGGCDIADVVADFKSLISQGVQLIEHEQIRGRSAAANSGLQAARGVWISFLDDDDALEAEGLARLTKFIDWDKDIIYGQVQLLHMAAESEQIRKGGIFGDPHDMDSLLLNNTIPICAYICKRELAIAVEGFDEEFEFLEDWEFFYRLSRQARVHYVSKLVANYCIWGESHITGKNREQEIHYRRKFFEKHLSSFSPDILQRTSLNFFEIMNRKRDDLHTHYHNLINQAEVEHANKLAHVQTAFEQKYQELEAANEHNQSLVEANKSLAESNQKQHDRMLELDIELRHIQAAFEQKIKEIEATNQHNKSLIETNQKQHNNILQLDSKLNTTNAQLTEKISTIDGQLTEKLRELSESQAQLKATQQEKQWYAEQVGAFQQCQQQTHNLQTQINQLTHRIHRNNQRWVDRMREVMRRTLMPVVFDTNAELLDLTAFGLTIELRGLIAESNQTPEIVPPYEGLDFPIPVLQGKTLQWSFTWQGPLSVSTLMLKIGTYCRVNHCHLFLSIRPVNEEIDEPIKAQLNGEFVKDSLYTAFSLDQPLKPGSYLCQLSSPNADNLNNVLAVWLTTNHKPKGGAIVKNYNYVSPNRAALSNSLEKFDYLPIISIVMPTYNTPEGFLKECLNSVVNQIYPHWELCIADDASTEPQVRKVLDSYQQRFPDKIKITYCETNRHISATSNAALELATGEFIALLDHDDMLTEDALFEVVKLLNEEDEQIDLIYSDEDKWDDTLECFDEPFFKPDWAPEILKGQMYIGHLGVYCRSLVNEIGGFREGLEGSQDWDLVLRFTEKAKGIRHIPKILYHWRKHSNSTAVTSDNKTYAATAGLRAVKDALVREGEGGKAVLNKGNNFITVHYPVKEKPLVSIIIPTKDKAELLKACIDSIISNTTYSNWEIIIVDNGSEEKETFRLFKHYQKQLGNEIFKICHEPGKFNFSHLVNQGVKAAQGSMILLLNNDTEVISSTWLEKMLGYAQREAIACVGCKLLYDDQTIQHAGVVSGLGGVAGHSHVNFPVDAFGYVGRLTIVANYSGTTAACMMIKRSLWEEVNGFDESIAVAFNDVDFCLKLLDRGYRHVVIPDVLMYHHESKSRGVEDTPLKQQRFAKEVDILQTRWQKIIDADPYYNQHLTQVKSDFSISQNSIYYCEEDEDILR